nr:helix-turn-helix domain-containing protein [Methylobacterium sp. ZNC0032]
MSTLLVGFALKARLHSRTRKLVLIKLLDHAREDGTRIYPSLKSIADDAECSVSTARRTLKEFCQVGLLRRVRDGGSKRGDTAHYELDVELLVRLKRDELWPALEAAAAHQPMGHDDDDDDEPGHAAEASRGDESCENKGVMVEGFHGDSLPNRDLRVSSDDTRTLTRNLTSEREGARERESTPASEGERLPAPTFEDFLSAYPNALGDNRVKQRSAWEGVPFDQRRLAIDGIGAYLAERKAGGLKSRLSSEQYLAGRCWIGLEAKAAVRQATQAAGAPVTFDGWTTNWWLLLLDRAISGKPLGFWMAQAEAKKSFSATQAEIAAAGRRVGELKPFVCTGPELAAWRPWLAAKGARIPVFEGHFRVFLPSETPPGGRHEAGDDDVALG